MTAPTNQPKSESFAGSTAPITCQHLLVKDDDTPPENIVYTMLSRPTNGEVLTGDAELQSVSNFTQYDINNGLLVFRHQGLVLLPYYNTYMYLFIYFVYLFIGDHTP